MLGMLGVGQGIEEFLITRRPADVVGRAGIGAVKPERVAQAGIRWQDFLGLDPMLPVVAEVMADVQCWSAWQSTWPPMLNFAFKTIRSIFQRLENERLYIRNLI